MESKFDKAFIKGVVEYKAPLTKELVPIVEGLRDIGRRVFQEPYERLKQGSARFANLAQQSPDLAWLELLFGRKERQTLIDKIKQAQQDGSNTLKHGSKQWDLRRKEVRDLINSMLKDQSKPQQPEAEAEAEAEPTSTPAKPIPVRSAPTPQLRAAPAPQIRSS